jgi:hypothetical protein
LSNFSAKNLLINSHQAHQIAAHPIHHLSMQMGLPDDNPSTFGDHYKGRAEFPKSLAARKSPAKKYMHITP